MTFPKKNTRTVSLRNGQTFQWHLNSDWDYKTRRVVVTEKGTSGQLLFVDPYHYGLLPGQATIRSAIRAAFRHGWTPRARKAPLCLRYDGSDFVQAVIEIEDSGPASAPLLAQTPQPSVE